MKNKLTKLVALAATAGAMTFGASAAWANLIGLSAITGCAGEGIQIQPGPAGPETQRQADLCISGNQFAGDGTADDNGSFSYMNGALQVTADFGTVGGLDKFTLTLKNTNTGTGAAAQAGLDAGTVMFFGGLIDALGGNEHLVDFTDIVMTVVKNDGTGLQDITATHLGQTYDSAGEDAKGAKIGLSGDWFMLDFSDAAQKVPGARTVSISATMVRAPEPGSLALLGALLIVFGVIRMQRGRFARGAGKLAS